MVECMCVGGWGCCHGLLLLLFLRLFVLFEAERARLFCMLRLVMYMPRKTISDNNIKKQNRKMVAVSTFVRTLVRSRSVWKTKRQKNCASHTRRLPVRPKIYFWTHGQRCLSTTLACTELLYRKVRYVRTPYRK